MQFIERELESQTSYLIWRVQYKYKQTMKQPNKQTNTQICSMCLYNLTCVQLTQFHI